ncbi:hypothetical protein BGW36DRAFT_376564 [Talaromyces proteolyticus]|uniref:Uncharacterized protein n=1 Tax=Talaromyces proteolyticus TaxID=1131652 RepID=A0AAD4KR93_9EURO|nr:uncharacterized protein BGW36DRAFT_376564 [Talaromyces proteolyticus]KAH8698659.1 hypothetical protein BGW36DRAFT_376564 [Talaromyces proteolyticus]
MSSSDCSKSNGQLLQPQTTREDNKIESQELSQFLENTGETVPTTFSQRFRARVSRYWPQYIIGIISYNIAIYAAEEISPRITEKLGIEGYWGRWICFVAVGITVFFIGPITLNTLFPALRNR